MSKDNPSWFLKNGQFEVLNNVWTAINMVQLVPVVILLWRRAYYQLKSDVLDMFKVMQYSFSILMFVANILHIMLRTLFKEATMTWIEAHAIRDFHIIYFQFSNQLWWFIMIVHLRSYKDVPKVNDYDER